jgi:hypothetical protein
MSDFYNKYKKTIKESAKRNYRKRIIWINEYLANKQCNYCGEPETVCLQFYPNDKEIRRMSTRKGLGEEDRKEILNQINQSKIVCSNCFLKLDNDITLI